MFMFGRSARSLQIIIIEIENVHFSMNKNMKAVMHCGTLRPIRKHHTRKQIW